METTKMTRRSRKAVSLEKKLEIIRLYEGGMRARDITKRFQLPGSTVRTIYHSKNKLKQFAAIADIPNATTFVKDFPKVKMEGQLTLWIKEQASKGIPVRPNEIIERAKVVYKEISTAKGSINQFVASKGWFHRFSKRNSLNLKPITNTQSVSSKLTDSTISSIKAAIDQGGYISHQVFNIYETSFAWKQMPANSLIVNQNYTGNVTLILGANASGDFKLKPALVYHTENPPELRGFARSRLPVVWMAHKKACVTPVLFQDWFLNYFEPAVELYCKQKGIPHKILLILDKSVNHPANLDSLYPNIRIVYHLKSIMKRIQPMTQGIVVLFKAIYLRIQLTNLKRQATDVMMKKYWTEYNIMNAIEDIGEAWEEISNTTMNGLWRKIWADAVKYFEGYASPDVEISKIKELFSEVTVESIRENDLRMFLRSSCDSQADQDSDDISSDEEISNDDNLDELKELKAKDLAELFGLAEDLINKFSKIDPIKERSMKVCKDLRNAYKPYLDIYEQKIKQKTNLEPAISFNFSSEDFDYQQVFVKEDLSSD